MSIHTADAVTEASVSLQVIRCKCGDPSSHLEAVCPQGVTEDLGVVAYHHKKRHKRILWALRNQFKGTNNT